MNERIKTLTEVAFNNANYPTDQQYRIVPNAAFCEKFAELIAKECMDLALGSSHRDDDMGAIIARKIKLHFAVDK